MRTFIFLFKSSTEDIFTENKIWGLMYSSIKLRYNDLHLKKNLKAHIS